MMQKTFDSDLARRVNTVLGELGGALDLERSLDATGAVPSTMPRVGGSG